MYLLHLSDIHFHKPRCLQPTMDPDRPVRAALENDVRDLLTRLNADVNAVLVTGDIAYQADSEEYQVAADWLDNVAELVSCPVEDVFTVPGNHDVDRQLIKQEVMVKSARSRIEAAAIDEKSDRLIEALNDDRAGEALMEPLRAYNQFAARYGCSTYLPEPFWKHDMPLGESHTLRLYGLNSVLLSGPLNDTRGDLFLGDGQTTLLGGDNVVCAAMMHHPFDWLADGDDVEDAFNNRAHLHLVGHKHRSRIIMSQYAVRVMAGAVNPSRYEGNWEPGYNLIGLDVEQNDEGVWLKIDTHVRVWQDSPDRFIAKMTPDGQDVFSQRYRLRKAPEGTASVVDNEPAPSEEPEAMTGSAPMDTENRRLVYRFWNLRPSQRRRIANDLSLLSEADLSLPEFERYRRAFMKAKGSAKIEALAEAIAKAEDD